MDSDRQQIEVGGETITPGTSLFHTRTEKVLWYEGRADGYVHLARVDGDLEMPEKGFRVNILTGNIRVEGRPTTDTT